LIVRSAALSLAIAFALAGCGAGATPPLATPSPQSPTSSPQPTSSAASTHPSAEASPSALPASVPWDADLLAVLPPDVDGLPLTPEPEAFAASASDAALVRDAAAGAVALVVDPATGDYAVSFVYRLRPGVFDESWFRDWRDSFDETVCEQAGGLTGNAESELGGRKVHIGSCAGGVRTYHAHLSSADADLVVSTQSLGEQRLGEQVMADLRA
jgi:hypothetical protein